MTDALTSLDRFRKTPLPSHYPEWVRVLYSPVDDVHGALLFLLGSAQTSLVTAMFGFDDPELADVIKQKLAAETCFVQLTLDSSQAGGVHEREILTTENYPASSIAIGRSERGAIMHQKNVIIDGQILVSGSTNWSSGGEGKQDNDLVVVCDPCVAAEARARLDCIHHNILRKASNA